MYLIKVINCKFVEGKTYPFLILVRIIIAVLFIISGILRCLGWFLGNKQKQSKEKLSPFECGFDNDPVYRFPLFIILNNALLC